jgi:hypothetical protein
VDHVRGKNFAVTVLLRIAVCGRKDFIERCGIYTQKEKCPEDLDIHKNYTELLLTV